MSGNSSIVICKSRQWLISPRWGTKLNLARLHLPHEHLGRSTAPTLPAKTDCGVDGIDAIRSAVAVRSSPAAAERCAKGAGLDGIAHDRSTIIRAVKHGHLLHRRQATNR
jgi:hypothetical protein